MRLLRRPNTRLPSVAGGAPPLRHAVARRLRLRSSASDAAQSTLEAKRLELEPYALVAEVSELNGLVQVIKVRDEEPSLPKQLHNSLVLTLDGSSLPQSIYREGGLGPTNAYWDRLAALPWLPNLPGGPIGIYGWGAGTVPRLILEHHAAPPRMFGWEHDVEVLEATAKWMEAAELAEHPSVYLKATDALSRDAVVRAGFAGLIVDLVNGQGVVPQLMQAKAWNGLRVRMRPGGRIIAHLGPLLDDDGEPNLATLTALNAMREAFEGQLWVADMLDDTDPCLTSAVALGGRPPDSEAWAARLPEPLQQCAFNWVYWDGVAVDTGAARADRGTGPGWDGAAGAADGQAAGAGAAGDSSGAV